MSPVAIAACVCGACAVVIVGLCAFSRALGVMAARGDAGDDARERFELEQRRLEVLGGLDDVGDGADEVRWAWARPDRAGAQAERRLSA